MTIPEILKEIDVIKNVVSPDAKVDLKYLNVDDEEIKIYAKEHDHTLFLPDSTLPYYWFCMFVGNIDVIVSGRPKSVKLIY